MSPMPSYGSDNALSYSEQVLSLHSLRTKMEVEQEENERLIQIYRLQNEQLETKNELLFSHV